MPGPRRPRGFGACVSGAGRRARRSDVAAPAACRPPGPGGARRRAPATRGRRRRRWGWGRRPVVVRVRLRRGLRLVRPCPSRGRRRARPWARGRPALAGACAARPVGTGSAVPCAASSAPGDGRRLVLGSAASGARFPAVGSADAMSATASSGRAASAGSALRQLVHRTRSTGEPSAGTWSAASRGSSAVVLVLGSRLRVHRPAVRRRTRAAAACSDATAAATSLACTGARTTLSRGPSPSTVALLLIAIPSSRSSTTSATRPRSALRTLADHAPDARTSTTTQPGWDSTCSRFSGPTRTASRPTSCRSTARRVDGEISVTARSRRSMTVMSGSPAPARSSAPGTGVPGERPQPAAAPPTGRAPPAGRRARPARAMEQDLLVTRHTPAVRDDLEHVERVAEPTVRPGGRQRAGLRDHADAPSERRPPTRPRRRSPRRTRAGTAPRCDVRWRRPPTHQRDHERRDGRADARRARRVAGVALGGRRPAQVLNGEDEVEQHRDGVAERARRRTSKVDQLRTAFSTSRPISSGIAIRRPGS